MSNGLDGKIALVTGGAQGIGRALALGLADSGCRVAVADVRAEGVDETAELITQRGADALSLTADVSQREAVQRMVDAVVARWGGLDLLINDAGVFPRATVLELDEATWDQVIDTNLKGTFFSAQAAARVMVARGQGGRIVNFASRAAFQTQPRGAHYSASKAGVIALTKGLAIELAPYRITANAIAPGLTNTAQPRYGWNEAQLQEMAQAIPLGRWAEPEDMVPAVLFLCGETGAYITGQTIHVNGGALMI